MKYGDRRGGLYDIKDCANFAQDATFVHVLHRPNEVLREGEVSEYNDNDADVTNVKGRETGRAQVKCLFDPVRGFYDDVSTQFPASSALPASVTNNRNETDIPF